MIQRLPLLLLLLLALGPSCARSVPGTPPTGEPALDASPDPRWIVHARFGELFDEAGVAGVFLAHDSGTGDYRTNDAQRAHQGFLPASTYKILNSLIALETGVVPDVDFELPWDGIDRGWARWNQDHSMRTALRWSCVWFYQELARRIGRERMQHHVDAVGYGNQDLSAAIDMFWLEGDLRISPAEQIDLLQGLHARELPFSQPSMDLVDEILTLETDDGYVLKGKTGWGQAAEPQVGWFVGFVERPASPEFAARAPLFFALQIDIEDDADAALRVPLAKSMLRELGVEAFAGD